LSGKSPDEIRGDGLLGGKACVYDEPITKKARRAAFFIIYHDMRIGVLEIWQLTNLFSNASDFSQ
jgi:hypothetical protein